MSENFITREEFDEWKAKVLTQNTVETLLSNLDRITREWVLGEKAKLETSVLGSIEQKIHATSSSQDTKNDQRISASVARAVADWEVQSKGHLHTVKSEVENTLLTTLRNKTEDIRSMVQDIATTQTSALRNEVDSKLSLYLKELGSRQNTFEELLLTVAQTSTQRALAGLIDQVKQLVTGELSSHLKGISIQFAELRLDVVNQLSEKVIDKQMIIDRMNEIESQITAKARSIIDFNIEQARANMEQSAKAEISEGVRQAASQIITGLR